MGALQLKPISKVVMMRLSPSQHPQPAMNLAGHFRGRHRSIGRWRLRHDSPHAIATAKAGYDHDRPHSPSQACSLFPNSESAPVQFTPSQQGQASVHVTAAFQIATVEFSPSFEIASIVLNASSKNVSVQLPGAGPSAIEGAPVFEIANIQIGGNGEIGLIQLNPPGAPRR